MISTGDLRKGIIIEMDNQLFSIMDYQHQKIGRGSAQVRMRLRNVRTGSISDTTVQAGSKFPRVRLDQRSMSFLYAEENAYYFMDQETYDQIALTAQQLGEAVSYLKDGMVLQVQFYARLLTLVLSLALFCGLIASAWLLWMKAGAEGWAPEWGVSRAADYCRASWMRSLA